MENKNPKFVLLTPGKIYQCEVYKVKDCSVECFELQTATLLKLKPNNCGKTRGLKKGDLITFKVLPMTYSIEGEIPVEIVDKRWAER